MYFKNFFKGNARQPSLIWKGSSTGQKGSFNVLFRAVHWAWALQFIPWNMYLLCWCLRLTPYNLGNVPLFRQEEGQVDVRPQPGLQQGRGVRVRGVQHGQVPRRPRQVRQETGQILFVYTNIFSAGTWMRKSSILHRWKKNASLKLVCMK